MVHFVINSKREELVGRKDGQQHIKFASRFVFLLFTAVKAY